MKQQYVLGFLFSDYYDRVVLIRKNKPSWQEGLLNGVGGKIEPGETPIQAMTREFNEEAGIEITHWQEFMLMTGIDFEVYCFKAYLENLDCIKSKTDELVSIEYVANLKQLSTIDNLLWIIPMALDDDTLYANIKYN